MEIFQNHVSDVANAVSIWDFLVSNAVWLVNCDLWRIRYERSLPVSVFPHILEFSAETEESHDRPHDSHCPNRGWSRTPPTQNSAALSSEQTCSVITAESSILAFHFLLYSLTLYKMLAMWKYCVLVSVMMLWLIHAFYYKSPWGGLSLYGITFMLRAMSCAL